MPKKKNGGSNKGMWFVIGAILLLVVFLIGQQYTASNQAAQENVEEIVEGVGDASFCANNANLDLDLRIKDGLATSIAYLNGTVYLVNKDTGAVQEVSVTSGGTSGFTTLTDQVVCGEQVEEGYELVIKTTNEGNNAGESITLSKDMLYRDPVEVTMVGTKHTLINAKAYDNDEKAKVFSATYADIQDFGIVNSTTFDSTTNATAKAIAADGFIDWTFTLQPATSAEAHGFDSIVAVDIRDDTNTDDWAEDSLEVTFDGTVLETAEMEANDVSALSAYEVFFEMTHPVGMTKTTSEDGKVSYSRKSQSTLDFYVETGDNINADYDPKIRIVELGDFQSTKDDSMILRGVGFQDDTSRTVLGSAGTETKITVNIS